MKSHQYISGKTSSVVFMWRMPRGRGQLKSDGTHAETRFRLSAKRTSPFKSAAGRQFSRLLAAEACELAAVMLDTPCSETVWRVLANHSVRQFPLHFPSRASQRTITFQLESNWWNAVITETFTERKRIYSLLLVTVTHTVPSFITTLCWLVATLLSIALIFFHSWARAGIWRRFSRLRFLIWFFQRLCFVELLGSASLKIRTLLIRRINGRPGVVCSKYTN